MSALLRLGQALLYHASESFLRDRAIYYELCTLALSRLAGGKLCARARDLSRQLCWRDSRKTHDAAQSTMRCNRMPALMRLWAEWRCNGMSGERRDVDGSLLSSSLPQLHVFGGETFRFAGRSLGPLPDRLAAGAATVHVDFMHLPKVCFDVGRVPYCNSPMVFQTCAFERFGARSAGTQLLAKLDLMDLHNSRSARSP